MAGLHLTYAVPKKSRGPIILVLSALQLFAFEAIDVRLSKKYPIYCRYSAGKI
jgi:hypothetical protein